MGKAEDVTSTDVVDTLAKGMRSLLRSPDPPKIGRYAILSRLGKGGFGEVFLGFDNDSAAKWQSRFPCAERVSQPENIDAYLNEARILASLDHPHIVPVYDVATDTWTLLRGIQAHRRRRSGGKDQGQSPRFPRFSGDRCHGRRSLVSCPHPQLGPP